MTTNSGAVTPQIAPVRCVVSTAASTPRTANAPYVVGGVENMHLTAPVLSAVAMVENTRQIADARTAADTVDSHSNRVPLTGDRRVKCSWFSCGRREKSGEGGIQKRRNERSLTSPLADKLCSQFDEIETRKACSRIASYDMSESVRRTTQQFDAKSFYES
jgi:hypothetical protein